MTDKEFRSLIRKPEWLNAGSQIEHLINLSDWLYRVQIGQGKHLEKIKEDGHLIALIESVREQMEEFKQTQIDKFGSNERFHEFMLDSRILYLIDRSIKERKEIQTRWVPDSHLDANTIAYIIESLVHYTNALIEKVNSKGDYPIVTEFLDNQKQ